VNGCRWRGTICAAALAGCAHAPQPYTFPSSQGTPETIASAAGFLSATERNVVRRTRHGLLTGWREVGHEIVNVDVKGYRPMPISDRRRIVVEVEPRRTGAQVTVRSEYETCPVGMPLDTTTTAAESCFRSSDISPGQQKADRALYRRLQEAVSSSPQTGR
jgi:hypothetical protein